MPSPPATSPTCGAIFHDLAERFKRRGLIVVLSDLFDDPDQILAGLRHFRHRRHEVVVFHVLDPAELDFPFRQTTLFQGLEELGELLTDPPALRQAYQDEIARFLAEIKKGCQMADIDYVPLRTDMDLDSALSSYLATRAARMR